MIDEGYDSPIPRTSPTCQISFGRIKFTNLDDKFAEALSKGAGNIPFLPKLREAGSKNKIHNLKTSEKITKNCKNCENTSTLILKPNQHVVNFELINTLSAVQVAKFTSQLLTSIWLLQTKYNITFSSLELEDFGFDLNESRIYLLNITKLTLSTLNISKIQFHTNHRACSNYHFLNVRVFELLRLEVLPKFQEKITNFSRSQSSLIPESEVAEHRYKHNVKVFKKFRRFSGLLKKCSEEGIVPGFSQLVGHDFISFLNRKQVLATI